MNKKLSDTLSLNQQEFLASLQSEASSTDCGCGGRGFTIDDQGHAITCSCLKNTELRERYSAAGLPLRFFGFSLNANWYDNQDGKGQDLGPTAATKMWIKKFSEKYIKALPLICGGYPITVKASNVSHKVTNVALVGKSGSGKSLLAAIIGQEALNKKLSVKSYDWTDLCATLRSFTKEVEQDIIVDEFKKYSLILIDGVSNYGDNSTYFKLQLDRLASARAKANKPIILTCGEDYRQLQSGEQWTSLLNSCFTIHLPSPRN